MILQCFTNINATIQFIFILDVPQYVYITANIISNGISMYEVGLGTHYAVIDEFRNALVWDYVISFPLKVSNLSADSLLTLTAWRRCDEALANIEHESRNHQELEKSINRSRNEELKHMKLGQHDHRYVPYGGTSVRLFTPQGALKQGKQKAVFFFGMPADCHVRGLNRTPGDELYNEYAFYDHPFRMEKKLEAYKAIMLRAHNTLMSNNQTSISHAVQDLGIIKQLGLGVGLPCMSVEDFGALDWLDRLVLTQVQHTLGQSLSRDRGVLHAQPSSGYEQHDEIQSSETHTKMANTINQLYKLTCSKQSADTPTDVPPAAETRLEEISSEILLQMQEIASQTWQPKPLESDLDNFCCLVIELPMLSNTVLCEERPTVEVPILFPPRTEEAIMTCAVLRGAQDAISTAALVPSENGRLSAANSLSNNPISTGSHANPSNSNTFLAMAALSTLDSMGSEEAAWREEEQSSISTAAASSSSTEGRETGSLSGHNKPATTDAVTAHSTATIPIFEFSATDGRFTGGCLAVVGDWDVEHMNLTEDQSRKLNFSTIRGNSSEKTKPNLEQKALLDKIVNSPLGVQQLTGSEKDLLYIYRYSLTNNKKSLVKLLLSIDWDVPKETEEVAKLLPLWKRNAPLDVAEALKLLGKERAFQNETVREYAVECVNAATDDELQLYLLQLVQALRYEPYNQLMIGNNHDVVNLKKPTHTASNVNVTNSKLQEKLLQAIEKGMTIRMQSEGNGVELSGTSSLSPGTSPKRAKNVAFSSPAAANDALTTDEKEILVPHQNSSIDPIIDISRLGLFLITRACESKALANALYWYLRVEADNEDGLTGLFCKVLTALIFKLASHSSEMQVFAYQLLALDDYLEAITACQEDARTQMTWLAFSDRYERVKETLNGFFTSRHLTTLPTTAIEKGIKCLPNPLDTNIYLTGVKSCAHIFKSKMLPVVLDMHAVRYPTPDMLGATPSDLSDHTDPLRMSQKKPVAWFGLGLDAIKSSVADITGSAGPTNHHDTPDMQTTQTSHPITEKQVATPSHAHQTIHFTQKLFFKQGDDLRTDQLILNLFTLMDSLLKKVNLDLKMRIYGVLATRTKVGIMEFVDHSMPVQAILDKYGSIRNYLAIKNPWNGGDVSTSNKDSSSNGDNSIAAAGTTAALPFPAAVVQPTTPALSNTPQVHPQVLDTFIKSCAGSCVMTYILAIGDRHLDNILITENGQLFHLDFGFVFGKDPKPYPSPFRLTREMAVAIGGENYSTSQNFAKFRSYCYQAYNWLRKSANLLTNLLSLMDERGIISDEKPMAIPDVLAIVEERLMLELSDEEAETHFAALIEGAITALAPKIAELAHILRMKMKG